MLVDHDRRAPTSRRWAGHSRASAGGGTDLTGPSPSVKRASISGLTLVINALATHVIEYGTLAADEGRSRSRGAPRTYLAVRWEGRGGAAIEAAPERIGFGSRLVDNSIASQFSGTFTQDWQREGVAVSISLPLASIVS
ncbi:hypothetical protein [Bosea sp. 2RAB26]|uniref:hypothetical protein n=1 Tax=Bosea sp. 2RAB26 TaxID=3237476 RepID=UPI003F932741